MDINKVLMEYDNMYGSNSLDDIGLFLKKKIEEAYEEQDYLSAISLISEMVGFCRETSRVQDGLKYCEQLINLMNEQRLQDTIQYATALINVANAYRAFGMFDESLKYFEYIEGRYKAALKENDYRFAELYNNWGLLYQDIGEYEKSAEYLEKALLVIKQYPDSDIRQATTHSNIAVTLLRVADEKKNKEDMEGFKNYYGKAIEHLRCAIDIHESKEPRDYHYSGTLAAMGDALYFNGEYARAAQYYNKALFELEKNTGKSDAYYRVEENYKQAKKKSEEQNEENYNKAHAEIQLKRKNDAFEKVALDESYDEVKKADIYIKNLDLSKRFYLEYGAGLIHEKYPDYEDRIAVGVVGEGSDCFGFDDEISTDHDMIVGFCMWLTESDYEKIGKALSEDYNELVEKHASKYAEYTSKNMNLSDRRGVFTTKSFYTKLLNMDVSGKNISDSIWTDLSDECLATVTNGEVFRDDLGEFSGIRNKLLAYYPENVRKRKLAKELYEFSQNAQSNYPRMMARKDYTTARLCISQGIKASMSIVYYLAGRFAPYYKWMRRGLEELTGIEDIHKIIGLIDKLAVAPLQIDAWKDKAYSSYEINYDDIVLADFEELAGIILKEMNKQGIVKGTNTFLDIYSRQLMAETAKVWLDATARYMVQEQKEEFTVDELVEKIVKLEWKQFDKVENEGGRADCQDNWNTFSIMRRSQYMAWPKELLESYYTDLLEAQQNGWNLITEKYARMMESTAPERYEELKANLPVRSESRILIQEQIIAIQVAWMEEFAEKYPHMAGNARSIHTSEDSAYNTSYETYLRGELGCYSDDTLVLYGRFVVSLHNNGENLAYNIMNNTAKLYGYDSVEVAEARLGEN